LFFQGKVRKDVLGSERSFKIQEERLLGGIRMLGKRGARLRFRGRGNRSED
jgi:hypothetical protein